MKTVPRTNNLSLLVMLMVVSNTLSQNCLNPYKIFGIEFGKVCNTNTDDQTGLCVGGNCYSKCAHDNTCSINVCYEAKHKEKTGSVYICATPGIVSLRTSDNVTLEQASRLNLILI